MKTADLTAEELEALAQKRREQDRLEQDRIAGIRAGQRKLAKRVEVLDRSVATRAREIKCTATDIDTNERKLDSFPESQDGYSKQIIVELTADRHRFAELEASRKRLLPKLKEAELALEDYEKANGDDLL